MYIKTYRTDNAQARIHHENAPEAIPNGGAGASPEAPGLSHDFISPEVAETILERAAKGTVYYEDLINSDLYSSCWDDTNDGRIGSADHERVQGHDQARRGFNRFMDMFVSEVAFQKGFNTPDPSVDWSTFGDVDGLQQLMSEHGHHKIAEGNQGPLPAIHYQTPRTRTEPDKVGRQRGDFLHFGLYSDDPKNHVTLSPDFDHTVRVYLNPRLEDTPEVAAEISARFIANMGYMPTGKFFEDSTAQTVKSRDDRLLFWAQTPQELTVLLQATRELQDARAELFSDRKPMALGEPVILNGQELPTVRLAQSFPSNREDGRSFNSDNQSLVQIALMTAFEEERKPDPSDPNDIAAFIASLREVATSHGRHPDNFAFNAGQDLGVIDAAIRAASQK